MDESLTTVQGCSLQRVSFGSHITHNAKWSDDGPHIRSICCIILTETPNKHRGQSVLSNPMLPVTTPMVWVVPGVDDE